MKGNRNILFVEDLYWPFGSHLLNIKWAMLHALKRGYYFVYRNNKYQIFINGLITTYFENLNTVNNDYILEHNIEIDDCVIYENEIIDETDRFLYKPDEYETVEKFHQHLLNNIYKPNKYVKENINSNVLIDYLRKNNIEYIGVHLRLGDKVNGPNKETELISINSYINECVNIRNNYGINNIVICSDTDYGIECIKEENSKLEKCFTIYYNKERRSENTWIGSTSNLINHAKLDNKTLVYEYIICFINFQLLLESKVIVGNFDSGFSLAAVEYRNNGIDVNVNKNNPPIWGIEGFKNKYKNGCEKID